MPQVKIAPEPTPDPKLGKERQVSGFNVPYFDLSDSIAVARVVRESGGKVNREQIAGLLKYKSSTSGAFKTRVSAAKAFGLIDQPEPNSDAVVITARGTAVIAPVSEAEAMQAKIDAFMSIPLFKLIYDEYKGRELPADVGLANLFENTHRMLNTRALPSVKVMMSSADTAGLFKINGVASRKMVTPVISGLGIITDTGKTAKQMAAATETNGGGSGGGGSRGGNGGEPPEIDAAFVALLRRLPEPGTTLSKAKRDNLVAAFTATVNWMYPAPETD